MDTGTGTSTFTNLLQATWQPDPPAHCRMDDCNLTILEEPIDYVGDELFVSFLGVTEDSGPPLQVIKIEHQSRYAFINPGSVVIPGGSKEISLPFEDTGDTGATDMQSFYVLTEVGDQDDWSMDMIVSIDDGGGGPKRWKFRYAKGRIGVTAEPVND